MNPISIYAEMTPNPATMKFVANKEIYSGPAVEFSSSDDLSASPLAEKLMNIPFVETVFISSYFITINKNDKIEWDMVVMDVREFLTDYLKKDGVVVKQDVDINQVKNQTEAASRVDETTLNVASTDVDQKIIDALEEYIRPAVEGDGGSIDFRGFNDGKVTVVLRGSCSGCPSASVTLKNGVEQLLTRMVPEVKEVVAEEL